MNNDSDESDGMVEEEVDEDGLLEQQARFPTPLPTLSDRVFTTSTDQELVWADQAFPRLTTYIDAYTWAADVLFKDIQINKEETAVAVGRGEMPPLNVSHWYVLPLYFMHRQSIELSLKQLLHMQNSKGQLRLSDKRLFQSHCLATLWQPLKPWLSALVGDKLNAELEAFEQLVREISVHDPGGDAGRYDTRRLKASGVWEETFKTIRPFDASNLHNTFHKMSHLITWIWSLLQERNLL